jgi:hypothetical protein
VAREAGDGAVRFGDSADGAARGPGGEERGAVSLIVVLGLEPRTPSGTDA